MNRDTLGRRITEYVLSLVPAKVGFADLGGAGCPLSKDLTMAVSVVYPLEREPLREIAAGPTEKYRDEYVRANRILAGIGEGICGLLKEEGCKALLVGPTTEGWDQKTLSAEFPHKTAATRAGLGWIGKSALLVTREYGSAVRLCTVLTDASLPAGIPVEESFCGDCDLCVRACPASAPSGRNWSFDLHRDEFIDIFACRKQAQAFSEARNLGHTICGICIAACPWTAAHLARTG